jgi:hypothetical protein
VSSGSRPRLPDRKASDATMCAVAPDPASLHGRGSGAPRVLHGGLRCARCPTAPDPASLQGRALGCRVSYNSGSCLPVGEGSGAQCAL